MNNTSTTSTDFATHRREMADWLDSPEGREHILAYFSNMAENAPSLRTSMMADRQLLTSLRDRLIEPWRTGAGLLATPDVTNTLAATARQANGIPRVDAHNISCPSGVVIFDRTLYGQTQKRNGYSYLGVAALSWGPCQIGPSAGVMVTAWTHRHDPHDEYARGQQQHQGSPYLITHCRPMPLHHGDASIAHGPPSKSPQHVDPAVHTYPARLLAALWQQLTHEKALLVPLPNQTAAHVPLEAIVTRSNSNELSVPSPLKV